MAVITEVRPDLDALSAHLAERAAALRPSVVSIHTGPRRAPEQRSGAGVIWQPDGLIVTNAHVVHEPRARVVLADGRARRPRSGPRPRRPAGGGERTAGGAGRRLRFPARRPARVRDGPPARRSSALAWGIVSAPVGTTMAPGGRERAGGTIQADLRLYPGNSGGPLADAQGRVVGINHMVAPPRLAFAIASATVLAFLARALGPRLGVRVRTVGLPPPLVQRLNLPHDRAVMVVAVAAGEAAARAGLLPGDVLLTVNDRWLDHAEALVEALSPSERSAATAGGAVPTRLVLRVLRGGSVREVAVELRSAG